jgi:hypothetical protein
MRIAYCEPKSWKSPTPGVRLIGSCTVEAMKSAMSRVMLPSVEEKPRTRRKFLVALATRRPCCCTSGGRSGTGELQLVLHLHLGDVGIGALLEIERDGHAPVLVALGGK